ncbi:hypothetical protein Ahia01_000461900 [Argonauta hians]
MKRRVRTLYPGFLVGTKGHSVLKKKTYAARKPSLDLEEIVVQRMPISRKTVEYSYPESVYSHSHASALSNAVVDDSYDLHHHSRGRDHHLLSKMNNALHPEEFHSKTPYSSPSSRSSMSRKHPRQQHTSHRSLSLNEPDHSSSETSCTALVPFLESARNQLSKCQPFYTRPVPETGNKRFTSFLHENPNENHDSPLTAYIKGKWNTNLPSPTVARSLSSNLHHPLFTTEDTSSRTVSLPRYSYLDSTDYAPEDEYDHDIDYSHHLIIDREKPYRPGQLLEELRRKRREREMMPTSYEDQEEGAYAIVYKEKPGVDDELAIVHADDEYDYKPPSRRRHRYLTRESSPEDDSDFAVVPYHSKLRKYQDHDDDLGINSLVSMATLRARDALRHITGMESKAGYLSIEGDIKPYGGELSTFKIESPFQMRGTQMITQRPTLSASNDAFENLVTKLRNQREDERHRLDTNYVKKKPPLQLTAYKPSEYSLRPVGYLSDDSYHNYSSALMPSSTPFDRTLVSSLTPKKSVHFEDEFEPQSSSSILRQLYHPDTIYRPEEEEADKENMAIAPRRRRYPIYEYTEEIPVKIKVGDDDEDDYDGSLPGRLSVVEKIRIKALLVGDDKLTEPGHHRRPRRRHYPDRPFQEHIAMIGVQDTSGLKASRPPAPPAVSTHSWKTIRDVEGYSKPHMSWEYRIDSHVAPELQIPKVSTPHVSMRDQVRGVHDKMDRHRQLLDRYSDRPAMDGLDAHTSAGAHTGGRSQLSDDMSGGDILGKVSPLRKKIRKVICKSRHDPTYYDD